MPDEKDPRVILPLSRELLERVDDFRFENRLNSRAEAIRRLLQGGLDAAAKTAPKRTARRTA
jgi:metal-responsive CopG/Arc/MetJ family transcriptional regulator